MEKKTNRPNILLISTDSQRVDSLGCMGAEHAVSPNVDRLAQEGVLYERAYTACPACQPARCSLLTGLHGPIHGAIENGVDPEPGFTPFTDYLKRAGYRTAIVGKSHFGPVPDSFDVKWHQESGWLRASFERAGINPKIFAENLEGSDDVAHMHKDVQFVDRSIEVLEQFAEEETEAPFFLFCSINGPHDPLAPPRRWRERFADVELPPLNYDPGEEERAPKMLREKLRLYDSREKFTADGRMNMGYVEERRRLYYAFCAFLDEQIGRLLNRLDLLGLTDDTLVIFTSDHGHSLYDHGFYDKHNFHDESWRVPLIMRHPGHLPAGERRDFAVWTDLPATIIGAAGEESPFIQGFDLYSSLVNGTGNPRRCAVGTIHRGMALATQRWTLEYYPEEDEGRLFDRQDDRHEQCDLWESNDHREVRDALLQALLKWRAQLVDVEALRRRCTTGGPIANNVTAALSKVTGRDAEEALGHAVAAIEGRFTSYPTPR